MYLCSTNDGVTNLAFWYESSRMKGSREDMSFITVCDKQKPLGRELYIILRLNFSNVILAT